MSARLDRPIMIVGSPRSGTTLLGELVARHPDVAYWLEPRPVWMHGNAYGRHDELTAADAVPRVARFVDRRFRRFAVRQGKPRFAEKTPGNALRLSFIHAVFPDGRIVNIIRDGRAAVRSMVEMRRGPTSQGLLMRRLRETPPTDLPANLPIFIRSFWRTRVRHQPAGFLGPRPVGWEEWDRHPLHLAAAWQWRHTVQKSRADGAALDPSTYLEIRYEDLVARPMETMRRVFDFADLSGPTDPLRYAATYVRPKGERVSQAELSASEQLEAAQEMEPMLTELGYRSDEF